MRTYLFFAMVLISFKGIELNGQNLKDYSKNHYNLNRGLALKGYDPVAYFTEYKAKQGSSEITYDHNGITYRFSSEENKRLFENNPKKYEPEYGGYCAYAMAEGDKVRIDPETFKVVDGRLFLFYNFNFTNTLKKWNRDETTLLGNADKAWKNIIKN